MGDFLIIVEGKHDAVFIRDYLSYLYEDINLTEDSPKKKTLKNDEISITIIAAGGYTAISKYLGTRLKELNDQKVKILIIQDADNPIKDQYYGGVELRNQYLQKIKVDLAVEFSVFLFPNNKDDGDIETLLLKIVNQEKYTKAFNCYKNYADCVSSVSEQKYSDELLEDKCKVFCYIRTYNGIESAKEENRNFNIEFWHLDNEELNPLKIFFQKNFNLNEIGKVV